MAQDTLAARVRAKYPGAYDDLDDTTLERQVRAKFPGVYDDLPSSEPSPAASRSAQPVQGPIIGGQVYPMGIDTADVGRPGGPQPRQGPIIGGQLYPMGTDTADVPSPSPPQPFAALGIQTVSDEDWDRLTPAERTAGLLKAAGLTVGHMLGLTTPAAEEAVEHPKTTLATAALSSVVPAAVRAVPTRAKAGVKFEEVMRAVGDQPVDVSRAGDVGLRVMELAERGGTMPKVVRDLLRRATDPAKGEMPYREVRDFYSNVSRLSADEMKRLPPVIKQQIGTLREALNEALAKTAASGGKEGVYRAAMHQYKIASRMHELSKKIAKWTAAAVGAGTAYKIGTDILD